MLPLLVEICFSTPGATSKKSAPARKLRMKKCEQAASKSVSQTGHGATCAYAGAAAMGLPEGVVTKAGMAHGTCLNSASLSLVKKKPFMHIFNFFR